MNLVRTVSLSQKQREGIRSLTSLCRQKDGIILSCPEDGDEFWLLYEENDGSAEEYPAAFFAVYKTEPDLWECYAFTRPDCRRQGYFSALCSAVCADSREEGEPDLCFITDNRCGETLEVLKHMDAEFLCDEYMMALEPGLAARGMDGAPGHGGRRDECGELLLRIMPGNHMQEPWIAVGNQIGTPENFEWTAMAEDFAEYVAEGFAEYLAQTGAPEDFRDFPEQVTVAAWLKPLNANSPTSAPSPAGSCRLSIHGRDVYLYALEILPHLRGRGYGACFMEQIISMLGEHGYSGLSLQVSGANEPALGLYKKTGFRITETLSYYTY